MNKYIIITVFLAIALSMIVVKKVGSTNSLPSQKSMTKTVTKSVELKLPKLLDLGSHNCIPCKAMAPILDSLTTEYAGIFDVEFIDVWEKREEGQKYGIRAIPTQIFFDDEGTELFRHEGFYGREEILNKFTELGIKL